MKTSSGHLTYCTNIHPGEIWDDHFNALKASVPLIKSRLSPESPFALGLRIANAASLELSKPDRLQELKDWLASLDLYVFTMNGFPFGGFHNTEVKDQVHAPDWTTTDRVSYTLRLFSILQELLPVGMHGGISTSPLSYKYWWKTEADRDDAVRESTNNILLVVDGLINIRQKTGKVMHLDLEPEPDGLLDNGQDFVYWYQEVLLPMGIPYLCQKHGFSVGEAEDALLTHVQLCYDVCHFAVGYEDGAAYVKELSQLGIRIGKIQISSALQIDFRDREQEKLAAIKAFNEPVYLHQVVARQTDGRLQRYADLPEAIADFSASHNEWRIHFHVPLFVESYGLLNSTREEIVKILSVQKENSITDYLEIETYTWGVLPEDMQKPIAESIAREMEWVNGLIVKQNE